MPGKIEPVQTNAQQADRLHASFLSSGATLPGLPSRMRPLDNRSSIACLICRKPPALAPARALNTMSQPSLAATDRDASRMRRFNRFLSTALPICLPTLKAYRVIPTGLGRALRPSRGLYQRLPCLMMAANRLSSVSRRRLSKPRRQSASSCLEACGHSGPCVHSCCSYGCETRARASGVSSWVDKFFSARSLLYPGRLYFTASGSVNSFSVPAHAVQSSTTSANSIGRTADVCGRSPCRAGR